MIETYATPFIITSRKLSFIDFKRLDEVLIKIRNIVILEITTLLLSKFPRTV